MSMTLAQQAARLKEVIRTITDDDALRRINVAYRRNCEVHPWKHLLKRFTLQTEAIYSTGTIAVTNASASVTGSSSVWVSSWVTAPSHRRMSIAGRSEPYDVSAIGGATAITLADSYIGESDSGLTYSLFRDSYPLPTDCGYTKLMALYDPDLRFRLFLFNQPRFIAERAQNPVLTGIPQCFTLVGQTGETTPRPQIQMYPAPSTVRAYHGWYFRRPDVPTSGAASFDWPAEFDDMHWLSASIDYYRMPRTYSARCLAEFKPWYADLFSKMKSEFDGMGAMEYQIEQASTGRGNGNWNPDPSGLSGSETVNWE